MHVCSVRVDHNLREDAAHGAPGFPIGVYVDELSQMEWGLVQWHWHDEVELAVGVRGQVEFKVGSETVPLREGEGIFVNAGQLHMTQQGPPHNALFRSVVFNPVLLSGHGDTAIAQKYVSPLLACKGLPYVHFSPKTGWQGQAISTISALIHAHDEGGFGHELAMQNALSSFWHTLVLHTQPHIGQEGAQKSSADGLRIKQMMQFIQTHYTQPLSLKEIAAAAGVSVSECCRCFGRMLNLTPFEYLVQYRLNKAARKLAEGDEPITHIAHSVGFNAASYFGKRFRQFFGKTPSVYRKTMQQ